MFSFEIQRKRRIDFFVTLRVAFRVVCCGWGCCSFSDAWFRKRDSKSRGWGASCSDSLFFLKSDQSRPRVRFSFGQHQEHGVWPLPRQDVLKSRTSGSSTQITDFRLVYARSEIWNNTDCQRLQKWTFTTTVQKLEVVRVSVLCSDQKKSGLWGRDWQVIVLTVTCIISKKVFVYVAF